MYIKGDLNLVTDVCFFMAIIMAIIKAIYLLLARKMGTENGLIPNVSRRDGLLFTYIFV